MASRYLRNLNSKYLPFLSKCEAHSQNLRLENHKDSLLVLLCVLPVED